MRRGAEPDCDAAAALAFTWICTAPLSAPAVTVTCAACVTVNLPVALITHELPSALGASDERAVGIGGRPCGSDAGRRDGRIALVVDVRHDAR